MEKCDLNVAFGAAVIFLPWIFIRLGLKEVAFVAVSVVVMYAGTVRI